jgi:enoyl-CoA hydratase/carnithine racemase
MMSSNAEPDASAPVLVRRDGPVAHVVLNRPAALNAVTVELAQQLAAAIREQSRGARVVVLRGAGGTFCVGGDVAELRALRAEGPVAMRRLFDAFADACRAIAAAPVPVVAAVEGYALAGGFELAQCCDIVVVRTDARLADHHANFAMLPGGGGSQYLPRLVGRQRALAHILTGDRLSGEEAVAWGLAYQALDADAFEPAVEALAHRLAAKDASTLRQAKGLVRAGLEMALEPALAMETDAVVAHLEREGAMARFAERGAR